jgi:glycosyltransferase involved in cell wall biosynthesis
VTDREQTPEVAYVLPDKMGGIFSYVENLLSHRRPDGFRYAAVLTDNAIEPDTRSREPLPADRLATVGYNLPPENLYTVLRRFSNAMPSAPGVLVANSWIELAWATWHDSGRAVVAINHGDFDYFYGLAVRHQAVIDAFVTYTEHMRQRLTELLPPERHDSIHLLPYGVDIPERGRLPAASPSARLRLVYVGRLSRDKGVFDLPLIDRALRARGVDPQWTLQGTGPDEDALKQAWQDRRDIDWRGFRPMPEVLALLQRQDVLVMPSRGEGLPVALLEAGAAGVVPVISNLPSGIPEVVDPGATGFRPQMGDIAGFAAAIAQLDGDRSLLERASGAVRHRVSTRFDAASRTAGYQALYARWRQIKRPRTRMTMPYGSRLDQPWIPNPLVKALRSTWPVRRSNAQGPHGH